MPRSPVHLAKPGRPEIWAALRRLRAATGEEIRAVARTKWRTTEDYLLSLCAAGWVAIDTPDLPRRDQVFRLVNDVGAEAPRVRRDGSAVPMLKTEALWRAIKMLGPHTAVELAEAAGVELLQAKDYALALSRAGYLLTIEEGRSGHPARYRLAPHRNTGPLPPQIQRTKSVYDPNLRQIVWADADAAAIKFDRGAP